MDWTGKFGAAFGAFVIPGLGIPAGMLFAGLIAAAISHTPEPGQPTKTIPTRIFGIVSDACIGGWLALAVLKFRPVATYGIHDIPPEVIAALIALSWQWLRKRLGDYFDRAFNVALDALRKRLGGGTP